MSGHLESVDMRVPVQAIASMPGIIADLHAAAAL
ncbi:MAG: hypothetical protein JWQ21_807 [Herminiimonas sp.]|nr:hypothetical protein [Herminiimonas sp.]